MKETREKSAKNAARKVGVTELVLRDGHQSLVATRMKTEDMLPICGALDAAGFWSLEVWGGATFDACVRFLREDPWQRLAQLRRALPNSRLQMLLRGQNLLGYRHYPDDVVAAFVRCAAKNGIDVFRVFDALNDFSNMRAALAAVKKNDRHAQGTICYTTSPVHSVSGFVRLAEKFAAAGCDSLAIKDMAGIMTPAACGNLVAAIKARVSLPLHIHSHSSSGLSAMCMLRAVEAGADVIDSAISSFAEGASHPATETMLAALDEMGIETGIDAEALSPIADYFRRVRAKYWQFESPFTRVDPQVLKHHVPGGMISNLTSQLREQNALDRIGDVLAEIPRVRADLGYPPLVTPMSQMVGAQAALNIFAGERYAHVSQEVKQYLRGAYGRVPGRIDPDARAKALGDAPADEADKTRAGFDMEKLAAEIEGLAKGEEDVLTCAMFPDIGKTFLQERAAGKLQPLQLKPPPGEEQAASGGDEFGRAAEYRVTVHGETYAIRLTGVGGKDARPRPLYFTVDGVSEEALIEATGAFSAAGKSSPEDSKAAAAAADSRPRASAPGHVTTTMPGAVVAVLVAEGQKVEAGEAVLVIEAMKMENEIHAPIGGEVAAILVSKGDSVKPGEALVEIVAR